MSVPGTAERSVAGSGESMVLLTEKESGRSGRMVFAATALTTWWERSGRRCFRRFLKVASGVWIVSGS